jgi:hypothetical protein
MTTLTLAQLADLLPIESVTWRDRRNDKMSGSGDSRYWQVEMADPLWEADIVAGLRDTSEIKALAARIRWLRGVQHEFWLFDPISMYPQMDPTGSIIGSNNVQVNSIGGDNASISLKGLTAGYQIKAGDKGQITYSSTKNFFFEFSFDVTANGSGVTAVVAIYPNCPVGLAVNNVINLKKPACKMIIKPGTFDPGTAQNIMTQGMRFTAVERPR